MSTTNTPISGKGKPTPKRSEQEKLNSRAIVSKDRKAAKQRSKEQEKIKREKEYNALKSGDEESLPKKDKGPVKRYVRDIVDARLGFGEFFLPAAVILLVGTFIFQGNAEIYYLLTLSVWVYMLLIVGEFTVFWSKTRRKLIEKFGVEKVKDKTQNRFLGMYAFTRNIQVRKLRLPRPYYDTRGNYPD